MEEPKRPVCRCPIRPGMTKQELLDEIYIPQKNCCHPAFICPVLDKEMRRATKEHAWKSRLKKKDKVKTGTTSTPTVVFGEVELDL